MLTFFPLESKHHSIPSIANVEYLTLYIHDIKRYIHSLVIYIVSAKYHHCLGLVLQSQFELCIRMGFSPPWGPTFVTKRLSAIQTKARKELMEVSVGSSHAKLWESPQSRRQLEVHDFFWSERHWRMLFFWGFWYLSSLILTSERLKIWNDDKSAWNFTSFSIFFGLY